MAMEYELRALRDQIREKSIFSIKLQKEVGRYLVLLAQLTIKSIVNFTRFDWTVILNMW